MIFWIVSVDEAGMKLLFFLKEKLKEEFSSNFLKKAIESQLCEVNGRTERFASTIVGVGDRISFHLEKMNSFVPSALQFPKVPLYEDSSLLICDKQPLFTSEQHEEAYRKKYPDLRLIHRLDRDTSGALLFSKEESMREKMVALFRLQAIAKGYLAVVDGIPCKSEGIIDFSLAKQHQYQGQTLWGIAKNGKGLSAFTEWHLEKKGRKAALLACFPKTGRMHQLRVHLNAIGHPLLGDCQYGRHFCCHYRPPRILLHASTLRFTHPVTGKLIAVEAPLPADFRQALDFLGLI